MIKAASFWIPVYSCQKEVSQIGWKHYSSGRKNLPNPTNCSYQWIRKSLWKSDLEQPSLDQKFSGVQTVCGDCVPLSTSNPKAPPSMKISSFPCPTPSVNIWNTKRLRTAAHTKTSSAAWWEAVFVHVLRLLYGSSLCRSEPQWHLLESP